jgi:hypothetical protein
MASDAGRVRLQSVSKDSGSQPSAEMTCDDIWELAKFVQDAHEEDLTKLFHAVAPDTFDIMIGTLELEQKYLTDMENLAKDTKIMIGRVKMEDDLSSSKKGFNPERQTKRRQKAAGWRAGQHWADFGEQKGITACSRAGFGLGWH